MTDHSKRPPYFQCPPNNISDHQLKETSLL